MADVLVIVDMQLDFLPGGALAVPDGDAVIAPINALASRFAHVVLTQDWHPAGHISFASSHRGKAPFDRITLPDGRIQILWTDHCLQNSAGAAITPALEVPHAELVIRKGYRRELDSYSAFLEADGVTKTGLTGYLRERDLTRVFVAGLATDSVRGGRRSTPRAAASRHSSSTRPRAGSIPLAPWPAHSPTWTRRGSVGLPYPPS